MDVMSDKAIGELWRAGHYDGLPHTHPGSVVAKLIRKLVEERAKNYSFQEDDAAPLVSGCKWIIYSKATDLALRDFSIPKEQWK